MSRFFSSKYNSLEPYTPGEQPQNLNSFVKLNTNESPFAPSEKAISYAMENTRSLNLYSDPECTLLVEKIAQTYDVEPDMVLTANGSDEILNFAFMAFTDKNTPAVFADITYGFYPVFASLNNSPTTIIKLKDDFSLSIDDYIKEKGTIFIANPNAPTGLALEVSEIERLVSSNLDRVVVIDEAYVDFGAQSAIPLTKKYDNILVCQTFSKSRSFAGGRLGYAIASKTLIDDLKTIKYSTNPYNVNSMTSAVALGVLNDSKYTEDNCKTIMNNRDYTVSSLKKLGFTVLDSKANFIFVSRPQLDGLLYYKKLKEKGILVRHFTKERIFSWCRVSIGTLDEMKKFLKATEEILKEII